MPQVAAPSITAKEYIDGLPDERKVHLAALRDMVRRIWPDIVEDMSFGMPTYHLEGHPLCAMANQKHFMALYIMHYDLLVAFKHDLLPHDRGKSCIRFKRLEPATLDLFDKILKYVGSQKHMSTFYGKPGNLRGTMGRKA